MKTATCLNVWLQTWRGLQISIDGREPALMHGFILHTDIINLRLCFRVITLPTVDATVRLTLLRHAWKEMNGLRPI
jgi:hypothetical protein